MIGKAIGDQPLANVLHEGAKNTARLGKPPQGQTDARQRDHGISSPVREPGITSQNRVEAATALDEELIRCYR